MKITTKKVNIWEYDVYKDDIFVGIMSQHDSGEWSGYDINDDWIGTDKSRLGCLKWCFE